MMKSTSSPLACWLLLVLASVAGGTEASKIVSWNAYSIQFIDAPELELLELPDTHIYRVTVTQGLQSWQAESRTPQLDTASFWPKVKVDKFFLLLEWLDADGKVIATESSWRTKAPDWQGFHEPRADWVSAADRNIAYLIDTAENGDAPYREPNVPVWMWSAASPTTAPTQEILGPGFELEWFRNAFQYRADRWPDGHDEGYPGCMIPAMIYGMTTYAAQKRPHAERALQLAQQCGDWALAHRLPDDCALPLFPYSTISRGEYRGGIESANVNLLRASWIGLSLVHLFEVTRDQRYLDYARHIAEVTARFQNGDGSFPYRLNPQTGQITESFCTGAIQFSLLVEALLPHGAATELRLAAERSIQWMLAYPTTTSHWQGGYEDIGEKRPYENLTHWETQILIQYLCRHASAHPEYLPVARRLNRFVEDQFVLFGPENKAHPLPIKGPLVFEQYACWWPMEGHAGYWIQTLLALHKATGEQEFLDKAMATGNAIVAQQFADGSISNWGTRWIENGEIRGENCGHNWYNTNALASAALYWLAEYCAEIDSVRDTFPPSAGSSEIGRQQYLTVTREALHDKIRGGLVAQLIGNLNGLPHEMKYIAEPGSIDDYVPALPDGARTDDDTDLEWLYLNEIQSSRNLYIPAARITHLWKTHVNEGIWCANQYARRLMALGINPPLTGNTAFNPWADFNLSGQFVCESFALTAPGMPQTASRLATHYTRVAVDGEPLQATQLFASMISTAFVNDDLHAIIQSGLAAVDPESRIAEIVRATVDIYQQHPHDWCGARAEIKRRWQVYDGNTRDWNGYELNTACTIAALLYGGGDLVATLRTAFNLGWDCDNNAATAATIVGVIKGRQWINDQGWNIRDVYRNTTRAGLPDDETITSFENRVIACAELVLSEKGCKLQSIDRQSAYKIPIEAPLNILNLVHGTQPVAELRERLAHTIAADLNGNQVDRARAVYVATCLGLANSFEQEFPRKWKAAVAALQQQAIVAEIAGAPHPSGDRFKTAFRDVMSQ